MYAQTMHRMFREPVAPSGVLLTTYNLKSKLSQRYDGISKIIKRKTIFNTFQPITHVINILFVTGIVPHDLKLAKVIPIYKSYRPVRLLPAISKILEKIRYKPKHSTIHPIIQLLNYCVESNNKQRPEITLAICDMSKAFDVIGHEILLNKLLWNTWKY